MDYHIDNSNSQEYPGNKRAKEGPPVMPKPILSNRGSTVMRLRVNFPVMDEFTENITTADIPYNPDGKPPERKNSKLLSEGLLKAMRQSPATFEASDVMEDDGYPDMGPCPPWITDNERRDSIEHARIKLGTKGASSAAKGRNQRDKRRMREQRRSTGVAIFDEIRNSVDIDDDENTVQETKRNTALNELSHHQLMQQTGSSQRDSAAKERAAYNAVLDTYEGDDQVVFMGSQNLQKQSDMNQENGLSVPERPNSSDAQHVCDELNKELDALVKGLQVSSAD